MFAIPAIRAPVALSRQPTNHVRLNSHELGGRITSKLAAVTGRDIYRLPRQSQSALIPVDLNILPHFSVSSTINLPKSATVIGSGAVPS